MNLTEFMTTTAERLPTARELLDLCNELGIRVRTNADDQPVLRTKHDDQTIGQALARLVRREPWRSQIIQANGLAASDQPKKEAPLPPPKEQAIPLDQTDWFKETLGVRMSREETVIMQTWLQTYGTQDKAVAVANESPGPSSRPFWMTQ